jgi:diguanylate cyclase (GGDEF)-like protein
MLDLDHFKAFNDAHGHDGGDALLAAFGRLLQASCRSEDIPCRYGGEEFTLILPEADLGTAMQRAQEIRQAIEALKVPHLQRTIGGITVWIGIALFPLHASEGNELKRLADAALYRAKRNGRNRIEVAAPE